MCSAFLRRSFVVALAVLAAACPPPPDGPAAVGETGQGEGEGEEGEEGEPGEGEGEGEPVCGDDVVDGTAILTTEGIVAAADGTLYFSQAAAIGRRAVDGTLEVAFAPLPVAAETVWGVMVSRDGTRLFAASPDTNAVYVVDRATGAVEFAVDGFAAPNGLTIDDDGHLFVSELGGDQIVRLDVGATEMDVARATVTTSIIQPNGVLVDGDDLLALSYNDGTLLRFPGGRLGVSGEPVEIASGLGRPDGIVRAADGSIYVSDNVGGRVLHVVLEEGASVDGVEVATGFPGAANIEFGAGSLRCDRLLVTGFLTLGVIDVGVAGAPVPWR